MRALIIVAAFLSLSGCSAMNFGAAERWVDGNTLYSTKLPSLEISVNPSFYNIDAPEGNTVVNSDNNRYRTGQTVEWFYFRGRHEKKALNIKISNLDSNGRIYFVLPDYSKSETLFLSSMQEIGGVTLKTNILSVDKQGTPYLLKAFGKLLGDTTKFQIFYLEKVTKSWLNKSSNFLSQQDHDEINEFNKRADSSFSLSPYSGVIPPSTQTEITNSKINKEELLTSYIATKIKDSDLESDILNNHPELSRCYGLVHSAAKRNLSKIKDEVVDEITNTMDKVITAKQIKALSTSVSEATIHRYTEVQRGNFSVQYFPDTYKRECLEFKRDFE